jgi:hypothetical protein
VKLSGWRATATKAYATPKGNGAALLKVAPSKTTSSKAASSRDAPMKADAAPKASAPPKTGVPAKADVQKNAVILSVMKAGVLKIGARMKRPSAEPAPKVNQARVDVAPSPASAPIR